MSEDLTEISDSERSDSHDSTEVWSGISQAEVAGKNVESDPTQKISSAPTETEVPVSEGMTSFSGQNEFLTFLGRYVPPHSRKSDNDDSNNEAVQKLTRHLKGLLNRYSS